jgi:hypothetical protein
MPTLDTACHEAAAQAKAGGASGTPGGAAITLLSLNNHAVVRLSTCRAPATNLPGKTRDLPAAGLSPAARLPPFCPRLPPACRRPAWAETNPTPN